MMPENFIMPSSRFICWAVCDISSNSSGSQPRLGVPVAINAMAAKLARLVYRMLRFGMDFIDRGAKFYEAQMHDLQVHHLKWKAAKLGFQLSEIPAA
jgi:hypothetical protein